MLILLDIIPELYSAAWHALCVDFGMQAQQDVAE